MWDNMWDHKAVFLLLRANAFRTKRFLFVLPPPPRFKLSGRMFAYYSYTSKYVCRSKHGSFPGAAAAHHNSNI